MNADEVLQLVMGAVEEYNLQVEDDQKVEPAANSVLFGRGGKLDSMGLVNLIILVEEKVVEVFGEPVTLADERAISQDKSPFHTIQSLADYLQTLIKEKQHE